MNENITIKKSSYDAVYNLGEQYYNVVKNIDEIAKKMFIGVEEVSYKTTNDCYDEFEKIKEHVPSGLQKLFFLAYGTCINSIITEKQKESIETYLVLNTTTGFHKIGRTCKGVDKRVSQFASMSAGNCYVIGSVEKDIENYLHKKYKKQRIKGEWFNLSEKEVSEIIDIFGKNS